SLYTYAKNVLIKYINTIEDVGDIPYHILEPVLKKISSPHQLKKLEANSPQIAGEDEDLWKKFIARDFGLDAVDKWVPKNPSSWSKVYDKHQKEASAAQERAAQLLKAQFEGLNSSKESGRTRLVEAKSLPPLRRPKTGGSGWGNSTNSWNHAAGSKTKNIIQKARREAKEISIYSGSRSRLAADTSTLRRGGVSETLQRRI
ncbi:RNA polymerase II transcription factor SIII subunit A-domain-containing protein, partial [Tricharina praecox]|uniref:RNA polymerase II transcription factor SIII subunit A-domain-containing protein n=1 Tax=Tricharina praecox TaxID=43433 RepID=UPI002220F67B